MKKLLLSILVSATMIACTTKETKTEAKTETTGTVTASGPDVDLIKKSITAFANGDWATYASTYADTAKSYHNIWPSNTDTTVGVKIPVIIEVFKKQREFIDGNLTIGGTIYEVVTMADGNKYGHSWVEMSWKSKKGVAGKVVVFNSFGINKDGKITYEWPIYDTKEVATLGQ
jgi:ABC-type antimicrobial peptide transport system ATPase subunit